MRAGSPVPLADNSGDTWVAAWADDGNLYSPSDDTEGFHKAGSANVAFNRIDGSDPLQLSGVTVNTMPDFGKGSARGADGCTWKSSGCASIDGVLYWVVARHKYGEDSGDVTRRQPASNASIIKSTDFGKTWTRPAKQNYDVPMFPGSRFATPYLIEYGRDRTSADGADRYVYAISNNGFWDNGDDMVLGLSLIHILPRAGLQTHHSFRRVRHDLSHSQAALRSSWNGRSPVRGGQTSTNAARSFSRHTPVFNGRSDSRACVAHSSSIARIARRRSVACRSFSAAVMPMLTKSSLLPLVGTEPGEAGVASTRPVSYTHLVETWPFSAPSATVARRGFHRSRQRMHSRMRDN